MSKNLDLLESLKNILGCAYISDLRTEPYNIKAKLILRFLRLSKYPSNQVEDAFEYLYSDIKK